VHAFAQVEGNSQLAIGNRQLATLGIVAELKIDAKFLLMHQNSPTLLQLQKGMLPQVLRQ